jgi:hypothetical protein
VFCPKTITNLQTRAVYIFLRENQRGVNIKNHSQTLSWSYYTGRSVILNSYVHLLKPHHLVSSVWFFWYFQVTTWPPIPRLLNIFVFRSTKLNMGIFQAKTVYAKIYNFYQLIAIVNMYKVLFLHVLNFENSHPQGVPLQKAAHLLFWRHCSSMWTFTSLMHFAQAAPFLDLSFQFVIFHLLISAKQKSMWC